VKAAVGNAVLLPGLKNIGSLGLRGEPMYRNLESKQSIALGINIGALKEMPQVRNLTTAPFENCDFLVESFNKAASQVVNEVAEALIYPVLKRHQEVVKPIQPAAAHMLYTVLGRRSRRSFAVIVLYFRPRAGFQPTLYFLVKL
jgi:hypothetical protein